MKRIATGLFLLLVLIVAARTVDARRGNPAANNSPKYQYYLVDSDDNDPRAPTFKFVDTLYGSNWHRVTGFASNDDASGEVAIATDSFVITYENNNRRLPPRFYSTNGLIKLTIDTFDVQAVNSAANTLLPAGVFSGYDAIICPLWGDMEFRTTGDSSKVFYRMTTDSCYVTYYNLFLKGTNGLVRATFQVAFAKADSSITFNYKSFDGAYNGLTSAEMFQKYATIGLQNAQSVYGTTYLDRGTYYAKSYSSALYAQNLHNSLAIRFLRVIPNFFRSTTVANPPYEQYELSSNSMTPKITIENLTSQDRKVYVQNTIINLATNAQVYSRTDSFDIGFNSSIDAVGTIFQAIPCGSYRLTSTSTIPSLGTDGWTSDNIVTRDFVYMSPGTVPFFDDFLKLDACNWRSNGAIWANGSDVMFDPAPPVASGAVVLNRRDANGNRYFLDNSADTLTSTPLNLTGKSNVWVIFSYQRGSKADSNVAGVTNRTIVGPEVVMTDSINNVLRGDSMIVEGLISSGAKWNPATADWSRIAAFTGGLDVKTQKYRVQLPASLIHDHTRIRFRYVAKKDGALYGAPFEDDDNWVIDGFQMNAATNGQTELEPYDMDLGSVNYTHIPRNVKLITPKVKIGSNGVQTNLATYAVRLVIKDAFNREVYHRIQSIYTPAPHTDTVISFPVWQIEGSQSGVFTSKIQMEQNFNEIRRQNDTVTLYRTLYIDDKYAWDDGVPDSSGTMVVADPHFYMDLKPLASDSLRGFDFYHLDATGTTNWTISVRDTNGTLLTSRSFSYNTLVRGFQRATFNPIWMQADSVYRIECNMTQGFGLGGDGSRGLVFQTKTGSSPKYTALYPEILDGFRDQSGNKYLTASGAARNGSGGGPLLPMVRPVFKGLAVALPIELASFGGHRSTNGEVALNFSTAKEENVHHFEVDRESENGWVLAGSLNARNARLGANYALVDRSAPQSAITYRLSEIDLDGSRSAVGFTNVGASTSFEPLTISVSPNPTASRIHLTINGITEPAQIKIYDLLGKAVMSSTAATSGIVDLDASILTSGTYTIEVISGNELSRGSVVIQK